MTVAGPKISGVDRAGVRIASSYVDCLDALHQRVMSIAGEGRNKEDGRPFGDWIGEVYDTALICIKDGAHDVTIEARKSWDGEHRWLRGEFRRS